MSALYQGAGRARLWPRNPDKVPDCLGCRGSVLLVRGRKHPATATLHDEHGGTYFGTGGSIALHVYPHVGDLGEVALQWLPRPEQQLRCMTAFPAFLSSASIVDPDSRSSFCGARSIFVISLFPGRPYRLATSACGTLRPDMTTFSGVAARDFRLSGSPAGGPARAHRIAPTPACSYASRAPTS